jgi:hypothetical protein
MDQNPQKSIKIPTKRTNFSLKAQSQIPQALSHSKRLQKMQKKPRENLNKSINKKHRKNLAQIVDLNFHLFQKTHKKCCDSFSEI